VSMVSEPEDADTPEARRSRLGRFHDQSRLGRFHDRALGRGVISVVVTVLVVCITGWNLPGHSALRTDVRGRIEPLVNALAIDQGWGVFAPNPSRTSMILTAEVEFADGSMEVFEFPDGDPLIGAYREFRWRKLERRFIADDGWRSLRAPTARWVAAQLATPARPVTSVTLVRYKAPTPKAGSGAERVYERDDFHVEHFDPPVGLPGSAP
jgi:hypothetical protein